ncbi:MAG TPA: DUF4149 domain-containing protein [Candidatus Angelobacter sp.]|nr:DUF4149 domain-containing protein [Candidatus Angelobacter sp.]
MSWLRALMLLALIVWIGGIVFFAFVLAPTAFHVLPNTELAANVVGPSLAAMHWMGIVSGLVFLLCSLTCNFVRNGQARIFSLPHVLIVLMLALTGISQFVITPRMRELRTTMKVANAPPSQEFDYLHKWSERLEGGVLFLGLGVAVLTARRFESSNY